MSNVLSAASHLVTSVTLNPCARRSQASSSLQKLGVSEAAGKATSVACSCFPATGSKAIVALKQHSGRSPHEGTALCVAELGRSGAEAMHALQERRR